MAGISTASLRPRDSTGCSRSWSYAELLREEVPNIYTVQPMKFQVVRKRLTGMYVAYTDFNTGLRTACVSDES